MVDVNLTTRQLELVMHLANGLRYEQIADKMNLSLSSVKQTIANAKHRTGAETVAHLVSIAIASGDLVWNPDDSTRGFNGRDAEKSAGG